MIYFNKEALKITLSDELNNPNYNWPKTILSMDIGSRFDGLVLEEPNGVVLPSEVSNGKLLFVTELKSGEIKEFTLCKKAKYSELKVTETEDSFFMTNSFYKITIPKNGKTAFIQEHKNGNKAEAEIPLLKEKKITLLKCGDIIAEILISAVLQNDVWYSILVRLGAEMEFSEIHEKVLSGAEGKTALVINYYASDLKNRFSDTRGKEKVTAYLKDKGEIPFVMFPYEPPDARYYAKCAAFSESDTHSFGLFISDANGWNDNKYPIWSSDINTAIRFFYNENSISATFPLSVGTRATAITCFEGEPEKIMEFHRWYAKFNLNEVKDYVLKWEENEKHSLYFQNRNEEVSYFKFKAKPNAELLKKMLLEDFGNLSAYEESCVENRALFDLYVIYDMLRPQLSCEDNEKIKSAFAFLSYKSMNENIMAVRNMLSGHPNFLFDHALPVGIFAYMFPMHPDKEKFISYTNNVIAKNLKYHVRPDVKKYDAIGGRWTENLGGYNFASLFSLLRYVFIVGNLDCVWYPNFVKWIKYHILSLTAPIDGKRAFVPAGAHSGIHYLNPFYPIWMFRKLAELMKSYDYELSEYLYNICPPNSPQWHMNENDQWRINLFNEQVQERGIAPPLKSTKLTGFGYILRAGVGTENETSLHLMRIDEGPNYRWGCAADGGCGVIYYNTRGKQYSYNRPEDVGDYLLGDVDNCTNFGVFTGKGYSSIGRGELEYPLIDFNSVQWVRADANEKIKNYYNFRGVMLADTDYAVIFDSVADFYTKGRFSWFCSKNGDFPNIYQITPGASRQEKEHTKPFNKERKLKSENMDSKGVMYEGYGDFLTIVSDKNLSITKTEFGAVVEDNLFTDYVFCDSAVNSFTNNDIAFCGKIGYVRKREKDISAACFDGNFVSTSDFSVNTDGKCAVFFSINKNRIDGKIYCFEKSAITLSGHAVLIDGRKTENKAIILEEGYHVLSSEEAATEQASEASGQKQIIEGAPQGFKVYRSKNGIRLFWGKVKNARNYILKKDDKLIYKGAENIYEDEYDGKIHTYSVCAENELGIGESSRETTENSMFNWDPMPMELFRRDTRAHEHGYDGFDSFKNASLPILKEYE